MKITPLEIEQIEFKSSLFGYDKKLVRNFLNELSNDLTNIIKENSGLKEKIGDLQKVQADYQAMEKRLQETLLVIQEFRNSVQNAATKDAERFINETKLQCNVMINEAEKKVAELKQEFTNLQLEKRKAVSKLKLFLQEELTLLTQFENE